MPDNLFLDKENDNYTSTFSKKKKKNVRDWKAGCIHCPRNTKDGFPRHNFVKSINAIFTTEISFSCFSHAYRKYFQNRMAIPKIIVKDKESLSNRCEKKHLRLALF